MCGVWAWGLPASGRSQLRAKSIVNVKWVYHGCFRGDEDGCASFLSFWSDTVFIFILAIIPVAFIAKPRVRYDWCTKIWLHISYSTERLPSGHCNPKIETSFQGYSKKFEYLRTLTFSATTVIDVYDSVDGRRRSNEQTIVNTSITTKVMGACWIQTGDLHCSLFILPRGYLCSFSSDTVYYNYQ